MEDKKFWWQSEFQYLLDNKILSRDELASLFGQIKSIIDREFGGLNKEIENFISELGHYKALYYGLKANEAKRDAVFISHIQKHLKPQEIVVCKICGKSVGEIYSEK